MALGQLFTLGFTTFNMVISLLMILAVSWLIKENCANLSKILDQKLLQSLNRIFDGPNKQPLYKVFYGFNHASTETWVRWVKSQNSDKQTRAFGRLAEYLQEPPKELGLITVEVIKAVILFEHESSYEILQNLIINCRNKWSQYKALGLFYEQALLGLVQINPEEAKKFLLAEMSFVTNIPDTDVVKICILSALLKLPDTNEVIKLFTEFVLDPRHSFELHAKALALFAELGDEHLFVIVSGLMEAFLKNTHIDSVKVLELCLERLLSFNGEEPYDQRVWNIISELCLNQYHAVLTSQVLAARLQGLNFKINGDTILAILDKSNDIVVNNLKEALQNRFNINEDEKALIEQSMSVEHLLRQNIEQEEIVYLASLCKDCKLPEFLNGSYTKLEKVLIKNDPGVKLITGVAEDDKLLLLRAFAKQRSRALIIVDTSKIILSPDKLDQLSRMLTEHWLSPRILNN
jgi:hypothetical protein